MDKLIQTSVCSIIYGTFKGKKDQELFRCPRELDDIDIPRYVDEHCSLLGFEDDSSEDLRNVPGKECIAYYRAYYDGAGWYGRWFIENDSNKLTDKDKAGVQVIINWFVETFTKGNDYYMKDFFMNKYKEWGDKERYLIKPFYNSNYKVMVDTKYGNNDYPVRIYVYHPKETVYAG